MDTCTTSLLLPSSCFEVTPTLPPSLPALSPACLPVRLQLCMSPSDYAQLSSMLSEAVGPSRIIFGLEGGYEPVDTAQAIAATLRPFLI